jgi:hypothetical protein
MGDAGVVAVWVVAAAAIYAVVRQVYRSGYRNGARDLHRQIEENDLRLTEHVMDQIRAGVGGPQWERAQRQHAEHVAEYKAQLKRRSN